MITGVLLNAMMPLLPGFFDVAPPEPEVPGLRLIPDFITPDEEAVLIESLDNQPWLNDLQRRVQHYGYRYDYKARQVTPALRLGVLPSWLCVWAEKVHQNGFFGCQPDQVIVNEYQPSQGIALHVDCVPCFGDTIASLSLGSGCVMDFLHDATKTKRSLFLPPRSLLILQGDARYNWQHGIAKRLYDTAAGVRLPRQRRVSLTFRTVL